MERHESLHDVIHGHRLQLLSVLRRALEPLAERCACAWGDADVLDQVLGEALVEIPCCQLLYAIDSKGCQVSASVGRSGADVTARGQNLSGRPYLSGYAAGRDFLLSDVYISRFTRRSCMTALQRVYGPPSSALGCLAADFDLRELPQLQQAAQVPLRWRQIRGDPAIRQNLFNQVRVPSAMDVCLNQVHDIVHELMVERGIFHAKLHYSSSRATLWLNSDPRRYRVHVLEEIIDPSVCLAYPGDCYPDDALLGASQLRQVLDSLVNLRLGDPTVYLRAASVNLINGLICLNFSCDGTHYMPAQEFLTKDPAFWFGTGGPEPSAPA
jgi:hypothetical protein